MRAGQVQASKPRRTSKRISEFCYSSKRDRKRRIEKAIREQERKGRDINIKHDHYTRCWFRRGYGGRKGDKGGGEEGKKGRAVVVMFIVVFTFLIHFYSSIGKEERRR